jgi:hypothetical protein
MVMSTGIRVSAISLKAACQLARNSLPLMVRMADYPTDFIGPISGFHHGHVASP